MISTGGEVKTETGKVITWSVIGGKMQMYSDGKYCGEAIVRVRPEWDTDVESPTRVITHEVD